jgi:para-nitrobenzyl esterase
MAPPPIGYTADQRPRAARGHGTNGQKSGPLVLGGLRFLIGLPAFNGNNPLKTAADYRKYIQDTYGSNADAVLAEYPLSDYGGDPHLAAAAARTDRTFACGRVRLDTLASRYVPVWAYEFADVNAPSFAPPQSFPYGAAHTLEIQYLFPLYHGGLGTPHPLSPAQEKLSDIMVSYWTTFAANSDPNSPSTPYWPRYRPQTHRVLELKTPRPTVATNFAEEHKCAFWFNLPTS